MKNNKLWLLYALITTVTWGVWGAFSEIPEKAGFPSTLVYVVWALTMIPCALVGLKRIKFKLEFNAKSIYLGMIIGLTGAGGQLILFEALKEGPAYIIFPIIALSPVVTIIMSVWILKERAGVKSWIGIIFALVSIFLFSYMKPESLNIDGYLWLVLAILIFVLWGVQAFFMKKANETMSAEGIFTYMAISAIILIPIALGMTDFSQEINWGFKGPYLTGIIQILNAIGALSLVYAFRYGKAMVVSPMTAAYPMVTVVISLIIYSVLPNIAMTIGFVLASLSIYLFATNES